MSLDWWEEFDDEENSEWTALGPYTDGFRWRLRQRLANNRIEWYDASDVELTDGEEGWPWPTLEEAKAACEAADAACRLEMGEDT